MNFLDGEVWGIDASKCTGFAGGLPGGPPRLECALFSDENVEEPIDKAFGRGTAWIATKLLHPPIAAFVEAPIPPTQLVRIEGGEIKGRTTFDVGAALMGFFAIFIGALKCKGVPVVERVSIRAWRSTFLHDPDLKGEQAKRRCVQYCDLLDWQLPQIWEPPNTYPERMHGRAVAYRFQQNAAEAAGIRTWGIKWMIEQGLLEHRAMPELHKTDPLFKRVAPQ
jgi:hypothetical protein